MKRILCLFALIFTLAPALAQLQPPQPQTVPTQAPQTQITTTAPVTSDTTISVGTIAGEVLKWIASAFGIALGSVGTVYLTRLMKIAGVQVTDQMKTQLQGIIVNGLNNAAANTSERLKGQGQIAIKSAIVADAVRYTQAHGAETITALGLDPKSGEAVEAIKARIETAIADPTAPTPAVLSPQVPPEPAPVLKASKA